MQERHRHRYEVDPEHVSAMEAAGLIFSGRDESGERMETLELPRTSQGNNGLVPRRRTHTVHDGVHHLLIAPPSASPPITVDLCVLMYAT